MWMHAVSSLRQSAIGGLPPLDRFFSAIMLRLPVSFYVIQDYSSFTMTPYSSASQHVKPRNPIPKKKVE
jgi:hypothetical protein